MSQREQIDQVIGSETIAVAGVSKNPNKFGSAVYRDLKSKGYKVVGLNPVMDSFEGDPCYKALADIPEKPSALICVVKPEVTEVLVREAHGLGIDKVWMQQGAESEEAVKFCRDNGMSVVSNACVMMYAEPVNSIHKFHRGLSKLFGKYQK